MVLKTVYEFLDPMAEFPHNKWMELKVSFNNKLLRLGIFLLLLYLLALALNIHDRLSLEVIKELFQENLILSILLFTVLFSIGSMLYVPGLVFLAAAVLALGKEWGGSITYFAAVISCCVSYFVVEFIGKDGLRNFDNKLLGYYFKRLDERPILTITILRLIGQSFPPLNYALAISRIKFKDYLVGTILGLPLPIVFYCYFFDVVFQFFKN